MNIRLASVLIVVGSVLFLVAAFHPVSRIFGIKETSKKLEIITSEHNGWVFAQWLFALGSIVTAIGVGSVAYVMRHHHGSTFAAIACAAMVIGCVFWSYHTYLRAADPQGFVNGQQPGWTFVIYTLLTMAGIALLGVALLQWPLSNWLGWTAIISPSAFLVLYIILGDLPPFVHYAVTCLVGVVIMLRH